MTSRSSFLLLKCLHTNNTRNISTSHMLSCSTKHWNPKFKKLRAQKVIKVELPDFDEIRNHSKLTPDEMRFKMKEKGVAPPRPWAERPMIISATGGIFEPYVPPEGDGKMSGLSVVGAKQKMEWLQKKSKSMMSLKKIRNYDEDFDVQEFAIKALDIYKDAHKALANKNEDKLHELISECCFPDMMMNVAKKTIKWDFIESLEPPRVVHVRCTDLISKENLFAQITIRVHSKQILAVYDRFGRLAYGSETIPKDVLEYVVFEKHMPDQYGLWRIHGKIIPEWMPPKESIPRTFRKVDIEEPPPPLSVEKTENEASPA